MCVDTTVWKMRCSGISEHPQNQNRGIMGRIIIIYEFIIILLSFAQHPWPMFHHDMKHTGRCAYVGPSTPIEQWRFLLNLTEGVSSPAIAKDGTIYIGSYSQGFYAISSQGECKWTFLCKPISSSPAIGSEGVIYLGADSFLYAINPDGTEKWRYQIGFNWVSSPVVGTIDNSIYIGASDSCLYKISNGILQWRFQAGDIIKSSPALDDSGVVYVGCYDYYLYAIDSRGNLKWRYKTNDTVFSSPAICESIIYFGSTDSFLYALNYKGVCKWRYKTGGRILSTPAIGKAGTVYFGSEDSYLYAVNPDGSLKWKIKVGNSGIVSSPLVDRNEIVYTGSAGENIFYAIDSVGNEKWRFTIPGSLQSSPAMSADGIIYFQTHYPSYLMAIGELPYKK